MAALEKDLPGCARHRAGPGEPHAQSASICRTSATLQRILRHAGMNVRIGSLLPDITAPTEIDAARRQRSSSSSRSSAHGNRLGVGDFDPCVVLLNNDLSAGIPDILRGPRTSRAAAAARGLGGAPQIEPFRRPTATSRRSSPSCIGIDPWLINPYFENCGRINFHERKGEECLEGYVAEILDGHPREVPRIRHRRGALRHRQGRRRHLRHGHHDGQGSVRSARPEPQAAQQDGGREGRPGSARRHRAGRRAHLRERSNEAVAEPVVT